MAMNKEWRFCGGLCVNPGFARVAEDCVPYFLIMSGIAIAKALPCKDIKASLQSKPHPHPNPPLEGEGTGGIYAGRGCYGRLSFWIAASLRSSQ
jgi:hypothetical protein